MRPTTTALGMRLVLRALALGTVALAMTACSLVNQRAAPPTPTLELLQSDAVQLAPECVATASMQVSFTVESSGRTSNIRPSNGPACIQAALVSWVSSFKYAPLTTDTPASVEWILVEGKRPDRGS